jgi:hypothetical protein
MTPRRASVIVLGLAIATATLAAAWRAAGPVRELDVVSRLSKFRAFYLDATAAPDEPTRWALWKKDYAIAAVPPTPEGEALARRQLATAWPRYRALIPSLPAKAAFAERTGRDLFGRLTSLFATGEAPIRTKLVLFVGQFDGNEFTVPAMNGQPPIVVMPVESPSLRVDLAHELAHSINFQLAGVKTGFGAPLGETVFLEGLAMHASKAVIPGLPDARYAELAAEPGWLARCRARKAAVLAGIAPHLEEGGPEIATRFTLGQGATGLDRELYCAGWFVVGGLLREGKTFPELARTPEDQMVAVVRQAIDRARR